MSLVVHCHQTTLVSLKRNTRQLLPRSSGSMSEKQDNTSIYPDFGGF